MNAALPGATSEAQCASGRLATIDNPWEKVGREATQ
jgi:hypothetical protein